MSDTKCVDDFEVEFEREMMRESKCRKMCDKWRGAEMDMMLLLYSKYNVVGDPMHVTSLTRKRKERQEYTVKELVRWEGERGEEKGEEDRGMLLQHMVECWTSQVYPEEVVSRMEKYRVEGTGAPQNKINTMHRDASQQQIKRIIGP